MAYLCGTTHLYDHSLHVFGFLIMKKPSQVLFIQLIPGPVPGQVPGILLHKGRSPSQSVFPSDAGTLVLDISTDLSYSNSIRTLYDAEFFFTLATKVWILRIRLGFFPPVVVHISFISNLKITILICLCCLVNANKFALSTFLSLFILNICL